MSDPLRPGDIHDDKDEKKKMDSFLVSDLLGPGGHGWECCSCGRESSPQPRRPSQTPDVFDHCAEALNKKIIVSISSTSASVKVRKSHLKKSYSIMTMTITTAGFIIVSAITIVIFIILTLLPMSLILVLKLAISRTESAISPVAKFCTTWWTHQPPTEFLFSRVFLPTSELWAFVFCFYYEAWVQIWLKNW